MSNHRNGHSIVAYGAYVPRYRLQHEELGGALGMRGGKGARVVASFDEDTTTMGVEAARRALTNGARPGSVYLATTSPAYLDKTNANAIHAALDLGHEGFAVDLAGSARSAVAALRLAAANGGLAVLSDLRSGRPGSADERDSGDAAAAFLFGDSDNALATIVSEASATAEFLDRWRVPGEPASRVWEERFGLESYMPLIRDAAQRALSEAGVREPDHVIVSSPHTKAAKAAAKQFSGRVGGAAPSIGYAGAADAGVQLADVLDRAEAGETILMLVAADGCDAAVLKTTDRLPQSRSADPVAGQIDGGRDVAYATYLTWRGYLDREPPRRPEPDRPAAPASARSENWKFGFVGSRCTTCERVHLPPVRVCSNCRSVDSAQRIQLAGTPGTVATYTVDRLAFSPSPPLVDVVVDFDGGGRYTCELTDADPAEIEIGSRVEMTFRRLYTTGGVHNYFWKARPATAATEEGLVVARGIRDRVAIVGMGCTPFREHWDRSADDLLVDAAEQCFASTPSIKKEDVEAYWLGTMASGQSGMTLSRPLSLDYKPVTRLENLCATGSEAMRNACYAVASGAYDRVMAIGVEKLKDSGFSGLVRQNPDGDGTDPGISMTAPAAFSLLDPAYCKKYGVDPGDMRDAMTHIAWKNHHNGALNPRAQFQKEVAKEKIAGSPLVAGRLGVFDCSGVSDGAACALIVPAEDAHKYTDTPMYVKALAFVAGPGSGPIDPGYDYTTFPEVVRSAEDAYAQAGITNPREEISLAEVHDCFTPTEIVLMEDMGFSERGQAWRDVLDGTFDLDGELPVNPDGGLKSFGHPVGASGLRMLFECWQQFRGDAGDRQIDEPKLGLTHNLGGRPGTCVSFISVVGAELG